MTGQPQSDKWQANMALSRFFLYIDGVFCSNIYRKLQETGRQEQKAWRKCYHHCLTGNFIITNGILQNPN